MRITASRSANTGTASRAAARPAASGSRFQVPDARPQGTPGLGAAASVASIGSLIALQSAADEEGRAKRAIRQGRDLLDVLDALKFALLAGEPTPASMAHLERMLTQAEAYEGDSRLKDLLDQIDLRARVELAKLKQARRLA